MLAAAAGAATAFETADLRIERLAGAGWAAEGISVHLETGAGGPGGFRVAVERLGLPAPLGPLRGLEVRCPAGSIIPGAVRCAAGQVRFRLGDAPPLEVPFTLTGSEGEYTLDVPALALPGASGRLRVTAAGGRWRAEARLAVDDAERMLGALAARGEPPLFSVGGGRAEVAVEAAGGAGAERLTAEVSVTGLDATDGPGRRAAEGLTASARVTARATATGFAFSGRAAVEAGAMYVEPVFLDASAAAPEIEFEGAWVPDRRRLDLERIVYRHPPLPALVAGLRITTGDRPALRGLSLALPATSLASLGDLYLRYFLAATPFADLEVAGEVALDVDWRPRAGTAEVRFAGVDLDDGRQRIAVSGLSGTLAWADGTEGAATALWWDAGRIFRVDLGPTRLAGRLAGRRFSLLSPMRVPLLDGELVVDGLEVRGLGRDETEWELAANLSPVSLEALTRAFGWPTFGGTLAGSFPAVRYAGGQVELGSDVTVRVFDGDVVVSRLTLEDPFGLVPRLAADVRVEGLSLDALTRAFSFGTIEGRLDGHVNDLVLEAWRPRSFDAAFATPEGDRSRHRISQGAANDLARLGGGGGVFSGPLLGLFKQFSYDRLGLRCRLENGVCRMGGVAPADRGYYIVKGGGLPPRLDVLGFSERVDWPVLVDRLRLVTTEGLRIE